MRGKKAPKRKIEPDLIYNNRLLTKLINRLMKEGKKRVAEKIVYSALDNIKVAGANPLEVFDEAIKNVSPRVEVRPRRVGGASYQVPVEVRGERRDSLAIRWLIEAAKSRPNSEHKTMIKKLEAEILDASRGAGLAVKKKEDTRRMAEANKAFAHFRW